MRTHELLLLSLISVASSSPAAMTGNELLEHCKNWKEGTASFSSGLCIGFIRGASQAYREGLIRGQIVGRFGDGPIPPSPESDAFVNRIIDSGGYYCFPKNVTTGQIVDVVVTYLERNPATRHLPVSQLLAPAALHDAFPCR